MTFTIDRRVKLHCKSVFSEIDTHNTKFILFEGWEYRIPILRDIPIGEHDFMGVNYDIDIVALRRYACAGKRHRVSIAIGYSRKADMCILNPDCYCYDGAG